MTLIDSDVSSTLQLKQLRSSLGFPKDPHNNPSDPFLIPIYLEEATEDFAMDESQKDCSESLE